jgi:hypothetical protein
MTEKEPDICRYCAGIQGHHEKPLYRQQWRNKVERNQYKRRHEKNNTPSYTMVQGHAVAQLVEALRYKPEGRGFNFRWCHWIFSLIYSFQPHYGPGVDSASNRNEYQQHFLGGKGGRCVGLTTLPPSCADVLKSGNFNLLEPSGHV